jgi:prevent-host-death family protein
MEARETTAPTTPKLQPMAIRAARGRFGELIDRVARGGYFLILRHSSPLAVLLPAPDYERLAEVGRRDQELAAILRGHGYEVAPWTTATVLETVTRILGTR